MVVLVHHSQNFSTTPKIRCNTTKEFIGIILNELEIYLRNITKIHQRRRQEESLVIIKRF